MTKLILVRHASTNDNNEGRLSGHINSELSHLAKNQIEKLTTFISKEKIDIAYCTPSFRTKSTIQNIISKKNLKLLQSENLKELHFGDFEGMTFDEIKSMYPDEFNKIISQGYRYRYPNGESLVDSYKRVKKEIDNILYKHKNETILICSHGGTIRNIIAYLIGDSHEHHWKFKIDNASVSIIEITDGFPVIHTLNNTQFLDK